MALYKPIIFIFLLFTCFPTDAEMWENKRHCPTGSIFSDQLNAAVCQTRLSEHISQKKGELFYRINSVCLYSPTLVMETLIAEYFACSFSMW